MLERAGAAGDPKAAGGNPGRGARFRHERLEPPEAFEPGSFRTIDPGRPGHTKLIIGRPLGSTKTRAQAVLHEKNPGNPGNPGPERKRPRAATPAELEEAAARARVVEILRELSATDVLDYVNLPSHRDHVSREYGLTPQQRAILDKILIGNPGHNPATPAAFARWRAQQVRRAIRDRERGTLKAARGRVREERERHGERVRNIRAFCRSERKRIREDRKAERQAIREARASLREQSRTLVERYRRMREQNERACKGALSREKRRTWRASFEAKQELADLREQIRQLRAQESRERARALAARPKERAAESDDAVRHNLAPELIPIFERVKRRIVGTPRMSRTEAFLKWVEENPGEVVAMQAEAGEAAALADIAELQREEAEAERTLRKTRGRMTREEREALAAEVPF